MSFPVLSYIDTFVRANEGPPLSSKWTSVSNGLKVLSNQAAGNAAGVNIDLYNAEEFGPDMDMFIEVPVVPADTQDLGLNYRIASNFNGYLLSVTKIAGAANDIWRVLRLDLGVATQVGADMIQEISNGDKIGIRAFADQHVAYYQATDSRDWKIVGTRTDAAHRTKDQIGLRMTNTTGRFGPLSVAPTVGTVTTELGSRTRPALFKPGSPR